MHKYSYAMNIYALFLYDLNFFVKKTCIFIQKGVLKNFIDSKKNEFYQIITIKDKKNKIKLN